MLIRALGFAFRSDSSSPSIAQTWTSRRPSGSSSGMRRKRASRENSSWAQPISVSGRWKWKASRGRAIGSRRFVNSVSTPVDW